MVLLEKEEHGQALSTLDWRFLPKYAILNKRYKINHKIYTSNSNLKGFSKKYGIVSSDEICRKPFKIKACGGLDGLLRQEKIKDDRILYKLCVILYTFLKQKVYNIIHSKGNVGIIMPCDKKPVMPLQISNNIL